MSGKADKEYYKSTIHELEGITVLSSTVYRYIVDYLYFFSLPQPDFDNGHKLDRVNWRKLK